MTYPGKSVFSSITTKHSRRQKKQHLLVFAFAVAENQKETKRKPTWKSQVSKNKKKPTVANSAIFYPKSSITPENQVTMYWVKSDNRTALAVIGLPILLKQPTKLKKDFLNGISIKLRTNTQIRDIFLGSEMPPLSHLWQEIVPAENFAFEKRLM